MKGWTPTKFNARGQIVAEHVQRHFRSDAGERFRQEVRRAHPGFERSERMLDGLSPQAHFSGVLVEPALHDFEKLLMLPARYSVH
jgi:hypothetical protein